MQGSDAELVTLSHVRYKWRVCHVPSYVFTRLFDVALWRASTMTNMTTGPAIWRVNRTIYDERSVSRNVCPSNWHLSTVTRARGDVNLSSRGRHQTGVRERQYALYIMLLLSGIRQRTLLHPVKTGHAFLCYSMVMYDIYHTGLRHWWQMSSFK